MKILVRTLNLFLFVIFSFLDVQIQASEIITRSNTTNVTLNPKNCLIESSVCSVLTPAGKKFELTFGKSAAILDENTAVLRDSATQITLLQGRVWVKTSEGATVRTEYGRVTLPKGNGEFWAEKSVATRKVTFSAVNGNLVMVPRGSQEEIAILQNYENWLGPVDKAGIATSGVPHLIDIENHVNRWARLYSGGKRAFKKEVHNFFLTWHPMVEEVSDKHRALALRTLASESEKQKKEAERQKVIHAERNRVRDMMLRRLGPGLDSASSPSPDDNPEANPQ